MNRLQAGVLGAMCLKVQRAESQEDAYRMAAALWPTIALSAPGDARLAREALRSAAASWGQERAS